MRGVSSLSIKSTLDALQRLDEGIASVEATLAAYAAQLETLGRQITEEFRAEAGDEVDRLIRLAHDELRERTRREQDAVVEDARTGVDALQKRAADRMEELVDLFIGVLLGQT